MRRRRWLALVVVVVVACASAFAVVAARTRQRRMARAADDLGALQACLLAGPVVAPETVHARILAIELSLSRPPGEPGTPLEQGWPGSCQAVADTLVDAVVGFDGFPRFAGRAELLGALDEPLVPVYVDPCASEPCAPLFGRGPDDPPPATNSATAIRLAAWWERVSAAAGGAGLVPNERSAHGRPRLLRPALAAPLASSGWPRLMPASLTSRHVGPRHGLERSQLLRMPSDGRVSLFTFEKDARGARRELLGGDDDAVRLVRRGIGFGADVIDSEGVEVWPAGVERGGAHAIRDGALVVDCPRRGACRLLERVRAGAGYRTRRERALPGREPPFFRGGVLITTTEERGLVQAAPPDDPFGEPTLLSPARRATESMQVCRHGSRTTLLMAETSRATMYVHDGAAWGRGEAFEAPPYAEESALSCDEHGATWVALPPEQGPVQLARCDAFGCRVVPCPTQRQRYERDLWLGVGENVLQVLYAHTFDGGRARDSVWFRFGPSDAPGELRPLVGDPAHGGTRAFPTSLTAIPGGALLVLTSDGYGPSLVVRVDRTGHPQLVPLPP